MAKKNPKVVEKKLPKTELKVVEEKLATLMAACREWLAGSSDDRYFSNELEKLLNK